MALNYTTFVSQLSNMMVIPSSDPNFTTFVPGCIDYAEQRIYRDLNLVATQYRDNTGSLTANSRSFTLPVPASGPFVTVQDVNVITPSSATVTTGTRNQLTPCALSMLDFLYTSEVATSSAAVPSLFAIVDNTTIAVGPSPGSSYAVEVIGTIRPTVLSISNSSTFLTTYLPDLFFAASMVFASAYMRNFGAEADNPQMSQSWESQYNNLLRSAAAEEIRKKYNTTYVANYTPQPTSGGQI